jgi:hypothetical protein
MTKEKLEKEADDYADKHAFRVPYDGSNKFYDDVDFKASKEGYLAAAEPREKRIAELEAYNEKLLNSDIEKHNKIVELKIRLANWQKYEKENKEAKDLIRNLLRVTYGEGWNYSLDWKVKAEEFLKEE